MQPDADSTGRLTCAKCGVTQPLTMFDQRFIGKTSKVTCASCRGVADEATKWQVAWDRHRASDAASAEWRARAAAEVKEREQEEQRDARREARAEQTWQELRARGFGEDEIAIIFAVHWAIRHAHQSWRDIKRRFTALTPPYTPDAPRRRASDAVRETVYREQQGRCFYCARALLPLSVWKRGSPAGRSIVDQMNEEERMSRVMRKDPPTNSIPELDHKIPTSRGGDHARDNLVYACRRCNQLKADRTASEFARYPHDPITELQELQLGLRLIYLGTQVEARGYAQFDAFSPRASSLRFPLL